MAQLYSRYESGTQLTAGTIVGSALGASGLNPLVDRLNSISTDNNLIIGSVVSGTNTSVYAGYVSEYPYIFIDSSPSFSGSSYTSKNIWINDDLSRFTLRGSIFVSGAGSIVYNLYKYTGSAAGETLAGSLIYNHLTNISVSAGSYPIIQLHINKSQTADSVESILLEYS